MRKSPCILGLFLLALVVTVGGIGRPALAATPPAFTPTKELKFVVPAEAGGNSDIPARIFAKYMNNYSAKEVKIVNLPGAGGRVGAKEVMRAKPDGYTFLLQLVGYPMQHALGVADFTYQDFSPIGYWLDSKLAVVVNAKSNYQTLDDLVKAAREKPEGIRVGSVTGTLPLFAVLKIEETNGVSFNKVDLPGNSKAPELLGNRIDSYVDGFGALKQFIDSGDFRCVAIISNEKMKGYESIPTFEDLGYKDYAYLAQSFGLWAPKGTPAAAIDYINNLVRQAAADPKCIAELASVVSCAPLYMATDKYVDRMKEIYASFQVAAKGIVQPKK